MNQFNDDQYDRVCDENEELRKQLADAEAAAKWLYGICTGKLVWCDIKDDSHPAVRWPWLEDSSPNSLLTLPEERGE